MEYNPRANRQIFFANAKKERRKVLVHKDISAAQQNQISLVISESVHTQADVDWETFKITWLQRHTPIDHFYIFGLSMDEVERLAMVMSAKEATSYELHGHFQGFLSTHLMSAPAGRLSSELAKAGGA